MYETLVSLQKVHKALEKLRTAYVMLQVSEWMNVSSKLFIYTCQVVFPGRLDMSHQNIILL